MTESKLIEKFWRESEMSNFSREAVVLFFYLLTLYRRQSKNDIVYLHPATLLTKITGFNQAALISASEELQTRNYIKFTPAEGTRSSGIYQISDLT
jgi:hypothetical protein